MATSGVSYVGFDSTNRMYNWRSYGIRGRPAGFVDKNEAIFYYIDADKAEAQSELAVVIPARLLEYAMKTKARF